MTGPCMLLPLESRAPVTSGSGMLVAVDTRTWRFSSQGHDTCDSCLKENQLLCLCFRKETMSSLQPGQALWGFGSLTTLFVPYVLLFTVIYTLKGLALLRTKCLIIETMISYTIPSFLSMKPGIVTLSQKESCLNTKPTERKGSNR